MFGWKSYVRRGHYYCRKAKIYFFYLVAIFLKMKISYKLLLLIIFFMGLALAQHRIRQWWPILRTGDMLPLFVDAGEETSDTVERRIESLIDSTLAKLLQENSALSLYAFDDKLRETFTIFGYDILSQGCLQAKKDADPAARQAKPFQPFLSSRPPIYIITPTYRRPEQIPDLTRMAQTLMHIDNIFWLVIEDAVEATPHVTKFLIRTGIPFEHLTAPMPDEYKSWWGKRPRGVSNRNRALSWLRSNATTGVFYFADDDNTYDIRLFEEVRTTKKVAMWPVGLCTSFGVSTPIVVNGTFQGFYDGWVAGRKFPVDMAGFAVSIEFLLQRPNATFPFVPGYAEDGFLKSLAPFEPNEMELKAQNCTEILVWHTQTVKNEPSTPLDMIQYNNTNLVILKQLIV